MSVNTVLDQIQIEFFKLYKEIDEEKLLIDKSEGNKSLWSTSNMFDLTPFRIERSRGNLRETEVFSDRPKQDRIVEGVFSSDKLVGVNHWFNGQITGFSIYSEGEENIIKEIKLLVDDYILELVGLNYFHHSNSNNICKMISANKWGAVVENYVYKDDVCSEILIDKRIDMMDEIIDLPNGITNVPINHIEYQILYDEGVVSSILDQKGATIYPK
ncbi:MAG: hypothetical protein P8P74_05580 [Crocinitomicaceae bacterium]|nr:hypothetical protein [Crocinitomicaceae bacterium]